MAIWLYRETFNLYFKFFWLCCEAGRILVPQPGIKPAPPATKVGNLNHWTTRDVPQFLKC